MSTGTQIAVPQGIELPAHLRTADAAALVAQYNAAAAGGIRSGGFPRISIKGSKFHEVDGDNKVTYMQDVVGADGKVTSLPLMMLESVIIGSNPNLSKAYYVGKYTPGDDREPVCSSEDGITPDAHIGVNAGTVKQHNTCAECPQNAWGSKISEFSGKEVKACTDNKRLVIIPVQDLTYKALALAITPAALKDWGQYVKALSQRGIPVNSVVTNITFDHTASFPKLQFAYGRFLTPEEFEQVKVRAAGDDVKSIITIVRAPNPPKPQGGAPATQPGAPATPPAAVVTAPPAQSAPQPTPEPVTPPRAKRTKAVDDPRIAHLTPALQEAVKAVGIDSAPGQAILAAYPAPAPTPQPTQVPQAPVPATPAPAASKGFGSGAAPVGGAAPSAATSASAASLAQQLAARLAKNAAPANAG